MTGRRTTDNTGLAKVAVQCSADTFVVNQTLVLRINICGENRHLRQALNVMPNAMTTVQQTNITACKPTQFELQESTVCSAQLLISQRF